eukprot:352473-Chlamydomonas_euryale.AAC.14
MHPHHASACVRASAINPVQAHAFSMHPPNVAEGTASPPAPWQRPPAHCRSARCPVAAEQ